MAIGNIADREQGSSVRTKLNLAIDDINSLAPISGLARTDAAQTFTSTVTVQGVLTAEAAFTVQGAFTSLGIDDNATAEVMQLTDSLVSITVPFSCTGLTSTGIDDNTTAERLQLSDTELILGASGANYGIINAVNDQSTVISGGNTETAGGNITFFGGAHATQANDIELRGSATLQLAYDDSVSTWDFQGNIVTNVETPSAGDDSTRAATTAFVQTEIKKFTSAEQTITPAGSLTLAHGITGTPSRVTAYLVNKTAEGGYSINDRLVMDVNKTATSATDNRGFIVVPDATNLNVRFGSDATTTFSTLNKTTGAAFGITNANWKIVFEVKI